MRWRWAWRVGVSSAADGAVSTGVVAGMRAHMPSFAHACACPSSMPVHAVVRPRPCPPSLIRPPYPPPPLPLPSRVLRTSHLAGVRSRTRRLLRGGHSAHVVVCGGQARWRGGCVCMCSGGEAMTMRTHLSSSRCP